MDRRTHIFTSTACNIQLSNIFGVCVCVRARARACGVCVWCGVCVCGVCVWGVCVWCVVLVCVGVRACGVCVCGVCVWCVCVGSIRQQSTKAYGELEAQHHTFLSPARTLC